MLDQLFKGRWFASSPPAEFHVFATAVLMAHHEEPVVLWYWFHHFEDG